MKYLITEEQSNEMIPLAIRRRIPDMDETLYEWLYNTNVGDDSENYERLNYIDYVIELLFDEYFLKAAENMSQEEIVKYFTALINIFGDRIGNYWDNYHDRDNLNENVSNFEKQKTLIEKLLSRYNIEGICGYDIYPDDDDPDKIGTILFAYSKKFMKLHDVSIFGTRLEIKDILKKYLGLKDIYIG